MENESASIKCRISFILPSLSREDFKLLTKTIQCAFWEGRMQSGGNEDEQHVDKYNCRCSNCLKKHGSLPLLVDVIELNQDKTEPQPSTSHDFSPKSNRKLMKCNDCDKIFTHKGDLNKHLRKHTGEQPFTCTICDRKFAHNSNLIRHQRLHSGDRPFSCDICHKNFSRKDKLELHKRSKSCSKTNR